MPSCRDSLPVSIESIDQLGILSTPLKTYAVVILRDKFQHADEPDLDGQI